ncbi:cystathionine beta-lyase [Exophiala aquamarina CBS 119918]|uniref:Cystathionine beta-lyase n=1 Tax=Exophiala aquamarina CBS 119918 TaxID=1182545 RepID=A0A072NWP7_9EURO|nr:cystathionine beta-lyase [Exophiala aquamarina CBS 119918]KEF52046.1 cystathionine beta-lyase [Exophiala aquamarina CBS 119918]
MRTLDLRTKQQSRNCEALVSWLYSLLLGNDSEVVHRTVAEVKHSSLQRNDMAWLRKQIPGGFGSVFMIVMRTEDYARRVPSKLHVFQHATSLGGVESLIEWRKMTDNFAAGDIIRISVGIESIEDLKEDLLNGLKAVLENAANDTAE